MSYVSKAVKFQHRIATGKGGLKNSGTGERVHVPTPTSLVVDDALVLSEVFVAEDAEPRLFLLYAKRDVPVLGSDWQSAMAVAFDVPHRDHVDAEHEIFWWDALAEKPELTIETKHYTDGSSATGPAPLPDQSPAQQDAEQGKPSADDLDTVAKEAETAEATAGKKVRVIRGSKA